MDNISKTQLIKNYENMSDLINTLNLCIIDYTCNKLNNNDTNELKKDIIKISKEYIEEFNILFDSIIDLLNTLLQGKKIITYKDVDDLLKKFGLKTPDNNLIVYEQIIKDYCEEIIRNKSLKEIAETEIRNKKMHTCRLDLNVKISEPNNKLLINDYIFTLSSNLNDHIIINLAQTFKDILTFAKKKLNDLFEMFDTFNIINNRIHLPKTVNAIYCNTDGDLVCCHLAVKYKCIKLINKYTYVISIADPADTHVYYLQDSLYDLNRMTISRHFKNNIITLGKDIILYSASENNYWILNENKNIYETLNASLKLEFEIKIKVLLKHSNSYQSIKIAMDDKYLCNFILKYVCDVFKEFKEDISERHVIVCQGIEEYIKYCVNNNDTQNITTLFNQLSHHDTKHYRYCFKILENIIYKVPCELNDELITFTKLLIEDLNKNELENLKNTTYNYTFYYDKVNENIKCIYKQLDFKLNLIV